MTESVTLDPPSTADYTPRSKVIKEHKGCSADIMPSVRVKLTTNQFKVVGLALLGETPETEKRKALLLAEELVRLYTNSADHYSDQINLLFERIREKVEGKTNNA